MRDDEALVLHGELVDVTSEELRALEEEVKRLRRELAMANGEIAKAKSDSARALGALRKQLAPLFRALQAVFGELDAAGLEDAPAASGGGSSRVSAVWESWKQKLGSNTAPARVIDALLQHGELNVAQLKVAAKMANQTVYDAIHRLNKLGLINKNGGRFSLKSL